jgi:putative nucleotidyltransferase with HDIG domain
MRLPTIEELLSALPSSLGSYAPAIAEIEAALQSPQCSLTTVAAAIEKDPDLTARLLRLGNSAFYGFPTRLATVSEAISLIGVQQVEDLILASSLIERFTGVSAEHADMRSFWRHSLGCGIGARLLAMEKRMPNADKFFVAGLLHDVGRLVLYSQAPEASREVFRHYQPDTLLLREAETRVLGYHHAAIGAALLNRWQFPALLVEAVAHHHTPGACDRARAEAAVVHVSDHLINALQLGSSGERRVPPLHASAWDTLGLNGELLDSVIDSIDEQFDAVQEALLPRTRATARS